MAEILMWLGATLLTAGLAGAALDGVTLALLTPTRKSPDRPVDHESRRFTKLAIKLQVVSVAIGAAFLMTGIAVYVTA